MFRKLLLLIAVITSLVQIAESGDAKVMLHKIPEDAKDNRVLITGIKTIVQKSYIKKDKHREIKMEKVESVIIPPLSEKTFKWIFRRGSDGKTFRITDSTKETEGVLLQFEESEPKFGRPKDNGIKFTM